MHDHDTQPGRDTPATDDVPTDRQPADDGTDRPATEAWQQGGALVLTEADGASGAWMAAELDTLADGATEVRR